MRNKYISKFKLHSIPILHKSKCLRYVSYSIPLMCSLALLLLIGNLFCVFSGTPEVFADKSDIMPTSTAPVSLTLASNNPSVATTGSTTPGGVAYASSNVKYTATDIKSYSLKISLANGKSNPINSGTTLTGTGTNKAVSTMGNNTWGYSWSDNTNADETTVTYSTVPTYGSAAQVKSGTTDVDTTGKIMFAAKFADTAPTGHYTTSVLLSLTATPKVLTTYTVTVNCNGGTGCPSLNTTSYDESYIYVIPTTEPVRDGYKFLGYSTTNGSTADSVYAPGKYFTLTQAQPSRTLYAVWKNMFNGITTMQQMTTSICADASINDSVTLTDTREDNTYTIQKLNDNKCWMTQSLRIVDKRITSADSDVSASFTIPGKTTSDFSGNTSIGASDGISGTFYTWCAATAGCKNTSGGNPGANVNASSSVCPKGWRLPTGGSSGELQALYDLGRSAWTTKNGLNGYWIGATNAAGGAFFPAAGYYNTSSSSNYNSLGGYWSSTAASATEAYYLVVNSDKIAPGNKSSRLFGYFVRCVAR